MPTDFTLTLKDLYGSSIQEKIELAHELFVAYGSDFLAQNDCAKKIVELSALQKTLSSVMGQDLQMGRLCVACASKPGGGCCSEFMSGENDAVQLFMNLCAGITVAVQRDDGLECCFLGAMGCILAFKPMFCLNYNCQQIKDDNTPAAMGRLDSAAGNLLCSQFQLEQDFLAFLREKHLLT